MNTSRVSAVGAALSLALLLTNCGSETIVGTSAPPPAPVTTAKQITDPADLIGGPLARGQVGDYLLRNDKIRTIIRKPGREFHFTLTYGGNIIDADLVRAPGDPDRDSFEAATPLINVASTVNVDTITVVNDGSDGGPAIIRTHGVDDLFDAFDPTNAIRSLGGGPLHVPDSAQDKDIPVEIVTTYTLQPGDDYVHIQTKVTNTNTTATEPLSIFLGDYVNGSGEFDQFVPGLGFGEVQIRNPLPFLGFAGLGQASGVSYGIIPKDPSSAFADSGITASLANQNVLFVLLGSEPPAFVIEPGATTSYDRYFVVGHGDVGSIVDAQNRILGIPTGTIRGQVQAGGKPAPNAIVSILKGTDANNVVDSFRTDANGTYEGTLPAGDYTLLAKAEGYPYESGVGTPTGHPITITAGEAVEQDVQLPGTGTLRVTVTDQDGKPIAAKASVVGFDASPDPRTKVNVFGVTLSGFVFSSPIKQRNKLMYGLADVLFVGLDGDSGPTPLPPGEYQVVVTHGPEYSAFKQDITITAGQTTTVAAQVAHVVDTEGFASADYHVHLINSHDCWVTKEERILTMLAEGVDHFVATDHDFRTDLTPDIERLGAQSHVAFGTSEETTTFDIGHFNIWPVPVDPNDIIGGSLDWGRAGVPAGQDYPSLGSYDLSPKEIFDQAPTDAVKQVNHVNSKDFGYLSLAGIDTMKVPPESFTPPTLLRQDPSITNLYDDGFTAMELWIEANRGQTATFLDENLGDWFNLLNQGVRKTATSDSDSHSTAIVQAAGPRNFVASTTDDPAAILSTDMAKSVNEGRVIGSNAPFLRVSITGDGDETAGLAVGQPTLVKARSDKTATLQIRVQSPAWAEFDTIDIYLNTVPTPVDDAPNIFGDLVQQVPRYAVSPTISLKKDADFKVVSVPVAGASRLESKSLQDEDFVERELQLDRDAWVVVMVHGTDGVSKPLWPMNPQDLKQDSNQTLADLLDGNLGEDGVTALAYSNPLFVDVDGNGQYDPAQ